MKKQKGITERKIELREVTAMCPFCDDVGISEPQVIIKEARDSTVLLHCGNKHLWGRYN